MKKIITISMMVFLVTANISNGAHLHPVSNPTHCQLDMKRDNETGKRYVEKKEKRRDMKLTNAVVITVGLVCFCLIIIGISQRDKMLGLKIAMFGLVTPILSTPVLIVAIICDLLINKK